MMQAEFELDEEDFVEWASRNGISLGKEVRDLLGICRGIRVRVELGFTGVWLSVYDKRAP